MNFPLENRQPGPLPWLVLLLCFTYLLAGTFGHDPWKTDDAVGLAVAHGFLSGGSWLVPSLAGEPWAEAEPLWHWIAAITAYITQWLLPLHDGARLASALFGALFLFFLAKAAKQLYGLNTGWGAPLVAIGTLGLIIPLHEGQPASAVLAAIACVYWGIALAVQRPVASGVATGIGLGTGFLAGGLTPLLPILFLLAVPVVHRRWITLALAVCIAAGIAGSWLVVLALNHPDHLQIWWASELNSLKPGLTSGHIKFLAWVAWPVLYIAPWTLWRQRRQLLVPSVQIPLIGLTTSLVWFLVHDIKTPATLPVLIPLILFSAAGCTTLRRGAANAWDWFSMMTISIAAGLLWLGATAMQTGWPNKIAQNATKLEPGFVAQFSLPATIIALVATVAWLMALFRVPPSPWKVVTRWAMGVTIVWVLLAALLIPWIDYGKTYRPVVTSLGKALPDGISCVGRLNLGPAQRAALDYFGGIRTRWGSKNCTWLIVQGGPDETAPEGWERVWEGHRPGDRGEWLRLYRRTESR